MGQPLKAIDKSLQQNREDSSSKQTSPRLHSQRISGSRLKTEPPSEESKIPSMESVLEKLPSVDP